MKKTKKRMLRIAGLLCAAGIFLGLVGLFAVGFDVKKISTVTYETDILEITEEFINVANGSATPKISFERSGDESCKIVCYQDVKQKHSYRIEDNYLIITKKDTRKWYDHIRVTFEEPELAVYLPDELYNAVRGNQ